MSSLKNKKVALVYDRVNKWGGAERVLLALHDIFPGAPLYTSVYNPRKASWAETFDIRTSYLQKLPLAPSNHELLPFLMPLAFESFSFDKYDLVISVTSEAAKGIITKPRTRHICYCLTPTRYLWSGFDEYFVNPFFRLITKPAVIYLRKWDLQAAQRPDKYIAISKEVQGRISKYYGTEAEVVYPPGGISNFKFPISNIKSIPSPNYFLIVSRLVPYKKIDLAIQVCNELKEQLVIIGIGKEEKKLKQLSGPTITFLGEVDDKTLAQYYANCKALVFPGVEDFGLTMVEAQTFGKPVIAFKKGGALEIIDEGKTGFFFFPQTNLALKNILQNFDFRKFEADYIKKQAEKFEMENFKVQFLKVLTDLN